jgi:hypothetical protein
MSRSFIQRKFYELGSSYGLSILDENNVSVKHYGLLLPPSSW